MKNTAMNFWDKLKQERSSRRNMAAILVCLSLIVAGGTAWALRMTGESQTAETYCGLEEHQHSESCVEKVLVCGYDTEGTTATGLEPEPDQSDAEPAVSGTETSGHIHSDGCYETQTVLACTETEHTHSEEAGCYDEDGNLICETPEHTHSEENGYYTTGQALICGLEEGSTEGDTTETAADEAGHIHTDECYRTVYTCGYDYEHTHTLSCYSNPDADVETAADWEKTFADVKLTGVYADDVLAIAKTQLDYAESTKNYQVVLDDDGNETTETKGYTRYGAWYGSTYADWDAMFVSFCLNYAKVPEETFPRDADCEKWVKTLSDPEEGYEFYKAAADYSPSPGDLVFFDTDGDEMADHVGIVSELTPEYAGTAKSYKDDAGYTLTGFKAIEGDSENSVKENEYNLTNETILGYGRLPENPELAVEEAGNEPDGKEAGNETRTITADAGDGVTITAAGRIPEGAYLTAQKLEEDQIAYIGENFADISLGKENFAYDIKICDADGTELELGQNIRITISGLEIADDAEINGYHLVDVDADSLTDADTGSTAVEELDVSSGEGGVSFDAEGFSVMVLTVDSGEGNYEEVIINEFKVTLTSGAELQSDDRWVWNPTDTASGHSFVYTADYDISGVDMLEPGTLKITLPLHILKDRDGNWADTFDCAYPSVDEVGEGDNPDFVYYIDEANNCVVIYNYSALTSGTSGYIEVSYTTTESTLEYVDTVKSSEVKATITVGEGETAKTAEDTADSVVIDTHAMISSTNKQTPTWYTEWQSEWGNKPTDADDYYYLIWPVYTYINKNTSPYNFTLTDTFSDLGGSVVSYRFSGSSEWVAPDGNGSATVENLTGYGYRYDYVLVKYSKEQADEISKNGLSYSVKNQVTATVNPLDQVDADTTASSTRTWAYEAPSYTSPSGRYGGVKYGLYGNDRYVRSSENISSYLLAEFLSDSEANQDVTSIGGLRYYTYVEGYTYPWTVEKDYTLTNTEADVEHYGKRALTIALTDDTVKLKALTYQNTGETSVSGEEAQLNADDYDITSLEWTVTMKTGSYDETTKSFTGETITDYAGVENTAAENGYAANVLYFYVKTENGEWVKAAEYNLGTSTYSYTNDTYVESASGKTIRFQGDVKGYRIETSNAYYYTEIGAYPTICLYRTDHVAQILTGKDNATADDLAKLEKDESGDAILTKIAVTNTAVGKATQEGKDIYTGNYSGTDYVQAVERHGSLKKNVIATSNSKNNQQYTITWRTILAETYVDSEGSHYVPQESGTFYDLLPAGAVLDKDSIQIAASDGTLSAGEYEIQVLENYQGTGRQMLVVSVKEETEGTYTLTYSTIHSWASIQDFGKNVTNNVAYETGNGDIGDGTGDNGTIEGLHLTGDNSDDGDGTNKFLYADASYSINALTAANTGLQKQVRAESDTEYSYSTVVFNGDTYSYRIRYANSTTTASDGIILMDSLENFIQSEDGGLESDWYGTLTGIDLSQLKEMGVEPVLYVSTIENLDLNKYYNADTGEYDLKAQEGEAPVWTEYQSYLENGGLLSGVKAIAVDCRAAANGGSFRLGAGQSLTLTLYMEAPQKLETDDLDPVTYNNIYVYRTVYKVYEEGGDAGQTELYHQDYTQVHLRVVGDLLLTKVNAENPSETVKGITYLLRGTSDYGTSYELTAVSDANGQFSFQKIEKGTYELVETKCSSDWQLSTEVYTVTVAEDGTVTITGYENPTQGDDGRWLIPDKLRAHGDLEIRKRNSVTEGIVPGAEFRLSGTSDYGNDILLFATSDAEGYLSFEDIEKGRYQLVEIIAPDGYIQNTTVWTVVVDGDGLVSLYVTGEDGSLTEADRLDNGNTYLVTNEPLHSIQFVKTSVYGANVYIGGVEFSLTGVSDYGTVVNETAVSAENTGIVVFENLEPGVYNLKETSTANAKDTSGLNEGEGLTYEPDGKTYTVTVNADGSFTISGLPQITIGETPVYSFPNTPTTGMVKVTKIWMDGNGGANRKPEDLDITISTTAPDPGSYGAKTVTFVANGGTFPKLNGETNTLTFIGEGDKWVKIGSANYVEPEGDWDFLGWYTEPSGGTLVNVGTDGWPDGYGDSTDTTLTLYAQYKYNMKYAVRLYGIQADKDADGNTLGLTFGPATGESYLNLKDGMTGTEAAENGSGSGYVAHISKADYDAGNICLHWMTWDQIAAQSEKDPTAFDACLAAGCTHSVKVYLNDTLKASSFTTDVTQWTGDGAGMFYKSIDDDYLEWNGSDDKSKLNYGGWAVSRVRYTLNGAAKDANTDYSGTMYLCSENNSLVSCFEKGLQDHIVAANKVSDTGYSGYTETYVQSGTKTSDELWLFSCEEMWGHTAGDTWTESVPEDVYSQEKQYAWTEEYRKVTTSSFSPLKNYGEAGSTVAWWLRSAESSNNSFVSYVSTNGGWSGRSVTFLEGLAPGFCLK